MKLFIRTLICLLLGAATMQAQSVKELEKQRKNTLRQLETTSKMLTETKRTEKATVNKLEILNRSINERKQLINSIGTEISALDLEMDSLQSVHLSLENELQAVRNDYARLVRKTHFGQMHSSWLLFLLSADSFDQMMRRLRYLREFANYRRQQAERIAALSAEISQKNEDLRQNRQSKQDVLQLKERERANLARDERKQKLVLNDLKTKEKDLRAKQAIHQKKANELNNRIERLIAEEIRRAEEARKKKAAAKKTTTTGTKPASTTTKPATTTAPTSTLTKEESLLAGDFVRNRGRLPWPVEKGFVSGQYGVQPHPVLQHVTINNKGIYLQTPAGSVARAVFDGVVTQRFFIPGSNNAVIVKHGNYRTVYANLTDIYVKEGDKVTAKQRIGKIYSDPDNDNKTELYFQVWQDRSVVNPSLWLAK